MTTLRMRPQLAWLVWTTNVLLWAAMLALIFQPRAIHSPVSFVLQRVSSSTFILSAATVGALVAWRRPRNPIGWLLSAAAFSWTGVVFSVEYALYTLVEAPGVLPAGQLALPINQVFHVAAAMTVVYLLLLFPSGRFLASRWALIGWSALLGEVVASAGAALAPGRVQNAMFSLPRNPFGTDMLADVLARGIVVGTALWVLSAALAAASLVVRFRQARGTERQQLKWLAFGAVCAVVCVVPWTAAVALRLAPGSRIAQEILPSLGIFALALVPAAIGIALLRYRLYDIDLVINRTLVYSIVTAVLAGVFAALSILIQRLALALTGQGSEAAVVMAALVVTALFQPLRARVQTLVDRRFYRAKYDASRTLERFANHVRDEVELDRLTKSLVAMVLETMQPTHASLWLRPRPSPPAANPPEPS